MTGQVLTEMRSSRSGSGTTRTTVIEVQDLIKTYPKVRAVDGVSFEVYVGEIFGMVGPNGAGKTTAIECIEGLRRPEQGHIRVLGMDPQKDGYRLREHIGIQFQTAALPARIKVGEAMDLFASFYAKPAAWRQLLEQLGLTDKKDAYVSKLSGGQKQRVFIALALINNPELVFLDELTTGLDPQARRVMWDLVRGIREQGKTVFLSTHFMEEAERLCDRVAIMDRGKIVALDSPGKLIASLETESRVVFQAEADLDEQPFRDLPGVARLERIGERVMVYGRKEGLLGGVVRILEASGTHFRDLRTEEPTLEDVFLTLTGKEMRD